MGLLSMLVAASPLAELIMSAASAAAAATKGGGLVLAVNPAGLALATTVVIGVVTVKLVADAIQDSNRQKKSNSGSKNSKAANGSKPKSNNGQNNGNDANDKTLRSYEWVDKNGINGFKRDPDRDQDITEGDPTCQLDAQGVIRQLLKAYKIALQKLEEAIRKIDRNSKKTPQRTYFPLDQWEITR